MFGKYLYSISYSQAYICGVLTFYLTHINTLLLLRTNIINFRIKKPRSMKFFWKKLIHRLTKLIKLFIYFLYFLKDFFPIHRLSFQLGGLSFNIDNLYLWINKLISYLSFELNLFIVINDIRDVVKEEFTRSEKILAFFGF